MTWHQKLLCRLVLAVAQMVARIAGEAELQQELKHIATHINMTAPQHLTALETVAQDGSQPGVREPMRPISTLVRDDA